MTEIAPGLGRNREIAMDIRVEIGRFRNRETGPSAGLRNDRRTDRRAARTSTGVSRSCHQAPGGSGTAAMGWSAANRQIAPLSEASPSAAARRWASKIAGDSTNAPQSTGSSDSSFENSRARPSSIRTRVPSDQMTGSGCSSTSTDGREAATSWSVAPSENT